MSRVGQRRISLLLVLALASPWAVALGAAVHVMVEHGHGHGHGRAPASLEHGHEHATGTPDHDHSCLPSAHAPVRTAPAAWAAVLAPDRGFDVSAPPRWLSQAHPPPSSARLLPGDLLRI